MADRDFLFALEEIITERLEMRPADSYTARIAAMGTRKIAQKVGEEGVEVALAAVSEDDARVTSEAADLIFHLLVLLRCKGLRLADVIAELEEHHKGHE